MDCRKAKKLISLYLDGEIEGPQADSVLAHLNSCEKCSQEMKFLSEMLGRLTPPEQIDPSSYFFSKVKQKIVDAETRPAFLPWQWQPKPAAAALLVLVVAVSFVAGNLLGGTFWSQVLGSENGELETALNMDTLKEAPEDSFTEVYNEIVGGAI